MKPWENKDSYYRFIVLIVVCVLVAVAVMELMRRCIVDGAGDAVAPAQVVRPRSDVRPAQPLKSATVPKILDDDTTVVSNLREQRYEIMERQTATLAEEAEKKDEDAGPRSLSLTPERIKALEKKGAMIN